MENTKRKGERLVIMMPELSKICLGCLPFGTRVSERDSLQMIDYARDHGVRFLDTANTYADGQSEICIGKAMTGRRSEFTVATKVGLDANLRRDYILEQADGSLRRLKTDYIDIYYLHTPDHDTPIEETLEAIDRLLKAGKIRRFAVSNYAAWQIEDICWQARALGMEKPIAAEVVYNMLCRTIEMEMVSLARSEGIGLTVYNPLAGGLLTGKYAGGVIPQGTRFSWKWNGMGAIYQDRYMNERNQTAVMALMQIAERNGITATELALQWCAAHKFVASVIIGATRIEQLAQNIGCLQKAPLSESIVKECDAIYENIYGTPFSYNR